MKAFAGMTLAVLVAAPAHAQSVANACEGLAALKLPNTTIASAQVVAAGAFVPTSPSGGPPPPQGAPAAPSLFSTLPAFCRVVASVAPTSDSDIKIEVWLPESAWNAKFAGVGNGGWAGAVSYSGLATALRRGYATASTDTGHQGDGADASFAVNHPEKLVDFAHRAVHEMTVQAKAIVSAYYGKAATFSYWNGCSTGGRQGLKEAQRFPDDYDGIVVGAPANYMTHLTASRLGAAHATLTDPARYIPREKFDVLKKGVMEACDALDGVKDGVLEDPTRCRFDPKSLACADADTAACLTPAQIEAVRKIYGPSKNPRTGDVIFPGPEPGSEAGWPLIAGGPGPFPIAAAHYKFIITGNPNWDFKTLDFDKDVALADKQDNGLLNTIDPNLGPFFTRGGKLLLWHGWSDQLIAPRNTINYYDSVVKALGGVDAVSSSMRLFMVPGMNHCFGGDGPSTFDSFAAIEAWVEQKKAPEQITASRSIKGVVDRTRPLCVYPKVATYKGTGSTDEAANFACKAP